MALGDLVFRWVRVKRLCSVYVSMLKAVEAAVSAGSVRTQHDRRLVVDKAGESAPTRFVDHELSCGKRTIRGNIHSVVVCVCYRHR